MSCSCKKGAELYAIVKENIKDSGFHIMAIFDPNGRENNFLYTIGLSEMGLPELFIGVSVKPSVGSMILHNVVNEMKKHGVEYGRNSNILHGADVTIVSAQPESSIDSHMCQIEGYYGHKKGRVAQILLPDVDGRFPGEVGYRMPQIVLEPLTTH